MSDIGHRMTVLAPCEGPLHRLFSRDGLSMVKEIEGYGDYCSECARQLKLAPEGQLHMLESAVLRLLDRIEALEASCGKK